MSNGPDQKDHEEPLADGEISAEAGADQDDDFDVNNVQVLTGPDADGEVLLEEAGEESDGVAEEPTMTPQDAILQSMISAKNEALEALDQTQKEAASLQDRLMRVSAEFENFKKRQARERNDAVKYANESLLKDILPVLDNFDRALEQMTADEADERVTKLIEGVAMVHKQFVGVLNKSGVEGFSAKGEIFDPNLHEAVSSREDTSVPNSTVLEEYQRGFKLNGRLVRPSMVIVSTGGTTPPKDQA